MPPFSIDSAALDPYVYPGTPNVLQNRFGIKSKEILDQIENDISAGQILVFLQDSRAIVGDAVELEALQKIHRHLFSDIYAWAGDLRASAIGKREPLLGGQSVSYPPPTSIIDDDVLMEDMISSAFSSNSTEPEKLTVDSLALLIKDLWVAHPFREGNTRSILLYAIHIANEAGLNFSGDLNSPQHSFRDLIVLAYKGDDTPLKSQLKDSFNFSPPKPSNAGEYLLDLLSSNATINKEVLKSLQKKASGNAFTSEESTFPALQ